MAALRGITEAASGVFCQGRHTAWGFADETIRSHYGIAVLVACECRLRVLRQIAQSLLLPGQLRFHFSKEKDRRRKIILSTLSVSPSSALYVSERGSSLDARTACWHLLVPMLLDRNVKNLVIERLEGVTDRDRRDIGDALRKADSTGGLNYHHKTSRHESILWFADAIAWAAGAKGDWLRRIEGLFRQ